MSRNYYTEISTDMITVEFLDGLSYRFFDFKELAPEGVQEYLVYVPESVDLLFYGREFTVRGSNLRYEVFVNPTFSSEGSSMASRVFNRNGDYAQNNLAQVWKDPILTADGILTDYEEAYGSTSAASGKRGTAGSASSQEFPLLLPKGSYNLTRVTNLSTTEPGNYVLRWFWSEVEK
jgi:hypothetical protein